ncbi:MAG: universal stress protein [Bacteroidetes bacterium]|nr:universal stress protein [Bacteroidota bacterium]
MIILSTRGASGLSSSILGSVSSEVLRKSSIPVLALPLKWNPKKKAVFYLLLTRQMVCMKSHFENSLLFAKS